MDRVDDEWEPAYVYKGGGTGGALNAPGAKYARKEKDFGNVLAAAATFEQRLCESRYAEDCAKVRDSCWDDHVCPHCHGIKCKMDCRHGPAEDESEIPSTDLAGANSPPHATGQSYPRRELGSWGGQRGYKGISSSAQRILASSVISVRKA